jgi:hypothetical protein
MKKFKELFLEDADNQLKSGIEAYRSKEKELDALKKKKETSKLSDAEQGRYEKIVGEMTALSSKLKEVRKKLGVKEGK